MNDKNILNIKVSELNSSFTIYNSSLNKELADRYENTLNELTTSTKTLEENVSAHLEKMGLVWN